MPLTFHPVYVHAARWTKDWDHIRDKKLAHRPVSTFYSPEGPGTKESIQHFVSRSITGGFTGVERSRLLAESACVTSGDIGPGEYRVENLWMPKVRRNAERSPDAITYSVRSGRASGLPHPDRTFRRRSQDGMSNSNQSTALNGASTVGPESVLTVCGSRSTDSPHLFPVYQGVYCGVVKPSAIFESGTKRDVTLNPGFLTVSPSTHAHLLASCAASSDDWLAKQLWLSMACGQLSGVSNVSCIGAWRGGAGGGGRGATQGPAGALRVERGGAAACAGPGQWHARTRTNLISTELDAPKVVMSWSGSYRSHHLSLTLSIGSAITTCTIH